MPKPKLSSDLKNAISALPDKEKDKLIFRLLPQNPKLIDRLEFTLLEGEEAREERRKQLAEEIEQLLQAAQKSYYSPGYLLLDLRSISAHITRHVQATKDKYGEIALNLTMLNRMFALCGSRVAEAPPHRSRTLVDYVIKRTQKILQLIQKLHPDLHLDFQASLEVLAQHIRANALFLNHAAYLELDLQDLRLEETASAM